MTRYLKDYPLILVTLFIPFISHLEIIKSRFGTELDVLTYWKDKTLWVLAFLALFTVKKSSPAVILFLGFLFWATFQSTDMGLSVMGMPNYSEGSITFLCYAILFLAAQTFDRVRFLMAFSLTIPVMAILALLQIYYKCYLIFPPIGWLSGVAVKGITLYAPPFPLYMSLSNPGHLGLFCALLFPIFFRCRNVFMNAATATLALLAIGCNSRGAWLAIILTLPLKFWKRTYPLLFVLGFIFYPVIAPKLLMTDSGRLFMWRNTLPLLHLLGRGPATFILDFPHELIKTSGLTWPEFIKVDRPHNMIFQVAHATGILSLFPLAFLVWNAVKRESIFRYGIISFLICGLFTDSFVGVTPLFCIMLGVASQEEEN